MIFKLASWYGLDVENNDRLLNSSILALFIHFFFFGCLALLSPKVDKVLPTEQRAIEIGKIGQAELNKYRRAGIKGGAKNFTMKNRGNTAQKGFNNPPNPAPPSSGIKNQKNISLDQLRASKVEDKDIKKRDFIKEHSEIASQDKSLSPKQQRELSKREIKAAEQGVPLTALRSTQAMNNFRRQKQLQFSMLKDMGAHSSKAEILRNTGFNLHFEPPEGIDENELNTLEKIFYSFQKRTFVGYVNSFLSNYQQTLNQRPQIKNSLRSERHLLTGRITFDKEGNIVRIKILRSSKNDDIHRLFEKTLINIRSLPNPPKAIIEDKEQFNIYYQLKIN